MKLQFYLKKNPNKILKKKKHKKFLKLNSIYSAGNSYLLKPKGAFLSEKKKLMKRNEGKKLANTPSATGYDQPDLMPW